MEGSLIGRLRAKKTKSNARLKNVKKRKDEKKFNAESSGPPDGFQFGAKKKISGAQLKKVKKRKDKKKFNAESSGRPDGFQFGAKRRISEARLKNVKKRKDEEISNAESSGPPDGFQFVLPFLDLSALLNVEMLNKPLREAVKDPLLWINLKVEGPACRKLTNKKLLKLVRRADGHLKSLFLADALAITDKALTKISKRNPGLERISVPGCTALSIGKFVSLVEAHSLRARAKGLPGISQVRVGRLHNILPEHLLRLEKALGVSGSPQNEASPSRRYYGHGQVRDEATDKRPLDVELCPECKNVGEVYHCTKHEFGMEESCNEAEDYYHSEDEEYNTSKIYRACIECIPRCVECGTCSRLEDTDMLSLCSGVLCDPCWYKLPRCFDCETPGCSLHVENCFPHGVDELCKECIRKPKEDFRVSPMEDFYKGFDMEYFTHRVLARAQSQGSDGEDLSWSDFLDSGSEDF